MLVTRKPEGKNLLGPEATYSDALASLLSPIWRSCSTDLKQLLNSREGLISWLLVCKGQEAKFAPLPGKL